MRDSRVDIIRGLAILLLTVTHTVPGAGLMASTGHFYPTFPVFFHGADVFVALSGLICGIVYTRSLERSGGAALIEKGLLRAMQLFVYNALAVLLVVAVVRGFNAAGVVAAIHNLGPDPLQAVLGTVFLFDPLPYFNILNFYIVMLLLLPFFVLAQARFGYTILISGLIYLAYSGHVLWTDTAGQRDGPFFVAPLAWQFLFFGATTVGMNLDRIRAALPPLERVLGPILLYLFVTAFLRSEGWMVQRLAVKYDLGILRLVDLMLVLYVIDRLVAPQARLAAPVLGKLEHVGRNSLVCFAVTLPLCYGFSNLLVLFDGSRGAYLAVLLLEVSLMLALGAALARHEGLRRITQLPWLGRALPSLASRARPGTGTGRIS